jgi:hypothetical protein
MIQFAITSPRKTQNSTMDLPYVFVGDEAFTLHKNFLKLCSQRIEIQKERFLITVCQEQE